jgi:acyl-CoA thioester hydrolase
MKHDGLSEFPVVVTLPVQWGDQDAFGHVNNTVYLRWCETARVEYLIRIGLWMVAPDGTGPILASIACDYRRPLRHPCNVQVGARVTRIGNTSFRMEHRIVNDTLNEVAAEAHSTLVVLNYKRNKPVPVPDAVRQAIERLEARGFERPAAG